jgi:hypothetical protein
MDEGKRRRDPYDLLVCGVLVAALALFGRWCLEPAPDRNALETCPKCGHLHFSSDYETRHWGRHVSD